MSQELRASTASAKRDRELDGMLDQLPASLMHLPSIDDSRRLVSREASGSESDAHTRGSFAVAPQYTPVTPEAIVAVDAQLLCDRTGTAPPGSSAAALGTSYGIPSPWLGALAGGGLKFPLRSSAAAEPAARWVRALRDAEHARVRIDELRSELEREGEDWLREHERVESLREEAGEAFRAGQFRRSRRLTTEASGLQQSVGAGRLRASRLRVDIEAQQNELTRASAEIETAKTLLNSLPESQGWLRAAALLHLAPVGQDCAPPRSSCSCSKDNVR